MSIVTLEEVKLHLRIEGNLDDALLTQKIGVAEGYIESFIGTIDEIGEFVPDTIKEAILDMVSYYYDGNSDAKERALELILPYRKWAF